MKVICAAMKENIAPQFLEYIGIMEGLSKRLYLFNVLDSSHPKYKSTIAVEAPK